MAKIFVHVYLILIDVCTFFSRWKKSLTKITKACLYHYLRNCFQGSQSLRIWRISCFFFRRKKLLTNIFIQRVLLTTFHDMKFERYWIIRRWRREKRVHWHEIIIHYFISNWRLISHPNITDDRSKKHVLQVSIDIWNKLIHLRLFCNNTGRRSIWKHLFLSVISPSIRIYTSIRAWCRRNGEDLNRKHEVSLHKSIFLQRLFKLQILIRFKHSLQYLRSNYSSRRGEPGERIIDQCYKCAWINHSTRTTSTIFFSNPVLPCEISFCLISIWNYICFVSLFRMKHAVAVKYRVQTTSYFAQSNYLERE